VALHGPGGAVGTAELDRRGWGTSIVLDAQREPPGHVLWVEMGDGGRWWNAGSYRTGTTGQVRVTLACALPESQIRDIRVVDPTGQEVLTSYTG